jgi:hypothetical protein
MEEPEIGNEGEQKHQSYRKYSMVNTLISREPKCAKYFAP